MAFLFNRVAALGLLGLFLVSGCLTSPNRGAIRAGDVTVRGVVDPGKPASLNTETSSERVVLPAGSKITSTEVGALPARAAFEGIPAVTAQAGKTITVIEPGAATEWSKTTNMVSADTGTVDTSVAIHKVDVAERRILLFVAIGCGLAGLVLKSMLPAWPGISNGFLLGSVFFGAAWKFSEIPAWAGVIAIVAVGLLSLGYKRAQWDKDGNGVPDSLEKK